MQVPIRILRNWAATNREIAEFITPKPLLPGTFSQFTLWVGPKPWTRLPHWKCPGCGGPSFQRRKMCRRCKKRIDAGLPTDLDEYLTDSEYRQLSKRMPGTFVVGGKSQPLGLRPPLGKG